MVIIFYDKTITFFLNINSNDYVEVWNYGFINKEKMFLT